MPAAIGAKLAHPQRVTIANCGDGGFLMTGQEMATAVQYGVNIITVVYNNSALATIRMPGGPVSQPAERHRLRQPGFCRSGHRIRGARYEGDPRQ